MGKIVISNKEYEVKNSITLAEKYAMANIITNDCIVSDEQGFLYVDELHREMITNICLVKFYTNYELPETITDDEYSKLESENVFETIKLIVRDDERLVEKQVRSTINYQVNVRQSVAYIVKEKLEQIIGKIPEIDNIQGLLENGIKAFNGLDSDKLKIVADSIGKKNAIKQAKAEVAKNKTK